MVASGNEAESSQEGGRQCFCHLEDLQALGFACPTGYVSPHCHHLCDISDHLSRLNPPSLRVLGCPLKSWSIISLGLFTALSSPLYSLPSKGSPITTHVPASAIEAFCWGCVFFLFPCFVLLPLVFLCLASPVFSSALVPGPRVKYSFHDVKQRKKKKNKKKTNQQQIVRSTAPLPISVPRGWRRRR